MWRELSAMKVDAALISGATVISVEPFAVVNDIVLRDHADLIAEVERLQRECTDAFGPRDAERQSRWAKTVAQKEDEIAGLRASNAKRLEALRKAEKLWGATMTGDGADGEAMQSIREALAQHPGQQPDSDARDEGAK